MLSWVPPFLHGLDWLANNMTWCLLGLALAWGLFEWRLQSENKPLIRLSALGSAALGLTVAAVLTAIALVVPLMVLLPEVLERSHR